MFFLPSFQEGTKGEVSFKLQPLLNPPLRWEDFSPPFRGGQGEVST